MFLAVDNMQVKIIEINARNVKTINILLLILNVKNRTLKNSMISYLNMLSVMLLEKKKTIVKHISHAKNACMDFIKRINILILLNRQYINVNLYQAIKVVQDIDKKKKKTIKN